MHIGSPAGQILNLSVNQMEEQLWLCICKTSGELLGSTECRALLKTHPPLQTASKISPFSKVSWGSGKQDSFGAWGNRAGDEALLCNCGMWQWNEELQGKKEKSKSPEEQAALGAAVSAWPWHSCVLQITPTDSHGSKRALTETPAAARGWVSTILKGSNNEKEY